MLCLVRLASDRFRFELAAARSWLIVFRRIK